MCVPLAVTVQDDQDDHYSYERPTTSPSSSTVPWVYRYTHVNSSSCHGHTRGFSVWWMVLRRDVVPLQECVEQQPGGRCPDGMEPNGQGATASARAAADGPLSKPIGKKGGGSCVLDHTFYSCFPFYWGVGMGWVVCPCSMPRCHASFLVVLGRPHPMAQSSFERQIPFVRSCQAIGGA